ncbi:Sec23-binding domain of Sec16-domain-containing protein [Ganoderma leucocontextum]|nr:Sec23-binding domain of Sec16-domain-containing protein [Ganoderma leucocontextum]
MSTAGEAADLFGAPDSSLDPFSAALGGDTRDNESNGTTQASNAVSDLFGSSTDEFPVDGTGSSIAQTNAQQTWYDSSGQQSYAYDNTPSTAYAPAYTNQTSYSQSNGTYAQHSQYGQSNAYNQPTAPNASAYEPSYGQQAGYASQQSYAPYTQGTSAYTPATNPSAYSPATSSTASAYAPAATAQKAPAMQSGSYSTSTYDPYRPAQTQSSYEPGSQGAKVSAPSTHNPYQPSYTTAPSAPAIQQTYPYGGAAASHTSTYAPSTVPVPPPPAPISSAPPAPPPAVTVTQYRPKTANAFDPPIPPPKTRHASGPPRQASYSSQSPVSPPPRTTLTPQSMPPPRRTPDPHGHSALPPRRTPDPHAYSVPPRRDSHSALQAPPQPTSSGPHAPAVNGTVNHAGYQPSYGSPATHGASGPYDEVAQAAVVYSQEGLPKVSEAEYANSALNGFEAKVGSPVRETIPEVDEEELQATPYESATPAAVTSSPQSMSAGLRPDDDPAWSAQPSHLPSLGAPLERAKSPRAVPPLVGQTPATTYDPYVPAKSNASDRAKSPGTSSVHSIHKHPYEPPMRDSITKSTPVSRPLSSQSRRSTFSSQYDPQSAYDPKRATSPTGSVRSFTAAKQNAYDSYAPAEKQAAHGRQGSNGSVYSTTSVADPYAPSRQSARQSSEHAYGSFTLPTQPSSLTASGTHPAAVYDRTGGQVVALAPHTHSTYAPSPSLLGTNDPLGRTSARIPVISFGFGGKLVTCFHGANMNTGFDVALSSRQSTDIKIQLLHEVIPESVLDTSAASYPGPLYSDPGSPTASLVRTGAQALKAKKARVIKYLEERAEEISGGLGYHRAGSVDKSRAEAKRVLVMLLKAMVENDGRLSGNAQVDAAIRAALVPQQGVSASPGGSLSTSLIPATSTEHLSNYSSLTSTLPNLGDQVVSQSSVRASQLGKISDLLARGDRRGACHYAADEKLWAHALLIASSVDKECWKDVVTEWIRAELVHDPAQPQDGKDGREPLRVAYSLFSGNGAAAVQELVHPSNLLQHGQNALQIPQPQLSITPVSPNFPTTHPLNISQEVLASWAQTASMILSNPLTPESSQALTALGDQLAAHQWTEAAHACYLLSPQTSPIGGIGGTSKLMLLGGPPPAHSPTFYKDPDPTVFSEILEFAMSLATPAKGQEAFVGLPHLQPYRLIRAASLAEIGHVQLANRYCEAITSCLNRGSPVLNITFVEQLKNLSDRLTAAPQLDKSGSWIGGKMAKPSLDSIGNWLEGRFTKFIAGEDNSPRPEESKGMEHQQQSFRGPFANYSSISSTTTSAYPSPHQSVTDLTEVPPVPAPPFRTGSAMAVNRPPSRSHLQINRATSAMDHVRPLQQQRRGSPIARVASANAAAFADAASNGQARGPYGYGNGYAPTASFDQSKDSSSHGDMSSTGNSKPPRTDSWWGASESDVSTPTASSFGHMDEQPSSSTSNSGFISLMDDPMLSMTPTVTGSPMPRAAQNHDNDDHDDDLGLGNSSKKSAQAAENGDAAAGPSQGKQEEKPKVAGLETSAEVKAAASSGWLSRLWKRNDSSPAPVKANLGEQSSFYFDKELGKWVNNTTSATESKPAAPPPPPRAQTASPSRSLGAGPPPSSPLAGGPPPTRPATAGAIDLTSEPPRRPPTRVRSNLVPSDATDQPSAPPSPMPTSGTPPPGNGPPTGRARSAAAKRNVRSRYVDVFQQEGSS